MNELDKLREEHSKLLDKYIAVVDKYSALVDKHVDEKVLVLKAEREIGFYWVKLKGEWTIAQWAFFEYGPLWQTMDETIWDERDIEEIDEKRITR